MITKDDVKKLAELARIQMSEEETATFGAEIDSILGYVGQISKLASDIKPGSSEMNQDVYNIWRDDNNANKGGVYREDLLKSAPDRQGNYLKVKKIL